MNYSTYGVERQILDNPTFSGELTPLVGLNATMVPRRTDSFEEPKLTHARLRELLITTYPGAYRENNGNVWRSYIRQFYDGQKTGQTGRFAGFSYEERGHSGDGKILPPTVRVDARNDRTPAARVIALPSSATKAQIPGDDLTKNGTFFEGGVYFAHKKPTCGGNSFGLPCVFGSKHPDSKFLPEWNTCSYLGSKRPWCYTNKQRSKFGYCDCEQSEEQWTRAVGWLPNYHNVGPAGGGDVYLNSDDLHHPVVGLMYEARPQATRLKTNSSLCVRSEHYGAFVKGEFFEEGQGEKWGKEIICPDGEVLTGLASAGEYRGGPGSPPPPAPPPQGGCDANYHEVKGDCGGFGGINNKGYGRVYANQAVCAAMCDSEEQCSSFEFSPSERKCALNTCRNPERGYPYKDFRLCKKNQITTGVEIKLTQTAPRCGIPAGYSVAHNKRFKSSRVGDTSKKLEVAANDGCDFRAMKCPDGNVAVGFKFDTSFSSGGQPQTAHHWEDYCRRDRRVMSMVLLCAPIFMEDAPNFRRICDNADCNTTVGQEKTVVSPRECTDLCEKTAGCLSVRITDLTATSTQGALLGSSSDGMDADGTYADADGALRKNEFKGATLLPAFAKPRKCEMFSGQCVASATNPFGKPIKVYSYSKPAVFSPVELEHPTTMAGLAKYRAGTSANVLINAKAITWGGTPWSICSLPCGTGVQRRQVFCAQRTANQTKANAKSGAEESFSLSQKIDDGLCVGMNKPTTERWCNQFHCDLECRVDAVRARLPCHQYQQDTRRNAIEFRTRQQACEQNGCCFVRSLDESKRMSAAPTSECYAKPFQPYTMWMEMGFGQCSADGTIVGDPALYGRDPWFGSSQYMTLKGAVIPGSNGTLATQSKRNLCMWTNGTIAASTACSKKDQPTATRNCNNMTIAPTCNDGVGCGLHGKCVRSVPQRVVKAAGPWIYVEKCECEKGWATPTRINATSSRTVYGSPCSVNISSAFKWQTTTSDSGMHNNRPDLKQCTQPAGGKGSTGLKGTKVECTYTGHGSVALPAPWTGVDVQKNSGMQCSAGASFCGRGSAVAAIHKTDIALCGAHPKYTLGACNLCDCNALASYGTSTFCNGEEATITGLVGKVACKDGAWNTKVEGRHPEETIAKEQSKWKHTVVGPTPGSTFSWQQKGLGGLGQDFLLLEHRTTAAIAYNMRTSHISTCAKTCRGAPNCPGFVWRGGQCSILDPFRMTLNPVNRGPDGALSDSHLAIRVGFFTTFNADPTLIAAAKQPTWSTDVANKVIAANRAISKLTARVPHDDPIWNWIDTAKGQQGVPLKKSFFSLAWPVHVRLGWSRLRILWLVALLCLASAPAPVSHSPLLTQTVAGSISLSAAARRQAHALHDELFQRHPSGPKSSALHR